MFNNQVYVDNQSWRINERNTFRNRLTRVKREVNEQTILLVMFKFKVEKTKTPSTRSDKC